MPITIYDDVILSESVLVAGINGSNIRNNTRAQNQGGYESINVNWSKTLRRYQIGMAPMLPSEWARIEGIHEVTAGGAYGFLMTDPKDSQVSQAEGFMSGAAGSVGPYTLIKRYTSTGSTRTNDRTIKRVKPAGLFCYVNGVSQPFTLNSTTGQITFSSAPMVSDNLSWSGSFYVPVHFEQDSLEWDLVRAGDPSTRIIMGVNVSLMEVRE